jgi:hypothetical protein
VWAFTTRDERRPLGVGVGGEDKERGGEVIEWRAGEDKNSLILKAYIINHTTEVTIGLLISRSYAMEG